MVYWLLEHHPFIFKKEDYDSAMVAAGGLNSYSIAELMLELGANTYNETMLEANQYYCNSIVWLMIEKGADDFEQLAANAASVSNIEMLDWVIETQVLRPETYYRCIRNGSLHHISAVEKIIQRIVAVEGPEVDLWSIIKGQHGDINGSLSVELFELLMRYPSAKKHVDAMLAEYALSKNDYEATEYLLEQGAFIPYEAYTFASDPDVLELLIEVGLKRGIEPLLIYNELMASLTGLFPEFRANIWRILNYLLHRVPDRSTAERMIESIYIKWQRSRDEPTKPAIIEALRQEYPRMVQQVEKKHSVG